MDAFSKKNFIKEYLANLELDLEKDSVYIYYEGLVFQINVDRAIEYVYLQGCETCPVDCYKRLPLAVNSSGEKYVKKIRKQHPNFAGLDERTFDQLTKIAMIKESPGKYVDVDFYRTLLHEKIHEINFFLIGHASVGKTTIFDSFPGEERQYGLMQEANTKLNTIFLPLNINLIDVSKTTIRKIVNGEIAPVDKDALRRAYMFIFVVDSTSKNCLKTKMSLLKPLHEICPSALKICIANKQDLKGALEGEAIQNLLKIRVYEFSAIDPKCKDLFNRIIFETIIIRIEQLKEHGCLYLEKDDS
ncbi:MAG: Rab family GTPase [Candidatus Helarchaeota archaeon]